MTIDPYTLCPGGCNQKIKFCCGKDVSNQLDKIISALEGEQRLSALDMVNEAIDKFGNKASLLAVKTNILFQLGEWDQARENIQTYLKAFPANPVALAMDVISRTQDRDYEHLDKIVEQLQRSLENIESAAPSPVVEAIRRVAIALYFSGRLVAARAHIQLYSSFLAEPDQDLSMLAMRMMSSPEIPMLLRQEHVIRPCEETTPWADEFNQIIEMTRVGRWLSAIEELTDLDKQHPGQPLIAKTIAILESHLGDPGEMSAAWSQFADTEGVNLNDAVEAEAFSQLVDPTLNTSGIDIVETTYFTKNVDAVMEKMVTGQRFNLLPGDQSKGFEDGPPPKGIYLFLDKEVPENGAELTLEQVPNVLGQVIVFGKQTDKDARVCFITARDEGFRKRHHDLEDALGAGALEKETSEEVVETVSRSSHALTWNWHFPEDTPADVRQRLISERRQQLIFEQWPDLPLDELDGKPPREVANEPYYKVPLLGAILLLELSESDPGDALDCNPLRKTLNLPTRDPIDPSTLDTVQGLSLVQIEQLEIEKLSDDDLIQLLNITGAFGVTNSLRNICIEVVSRESLASKEEVDFAQIHAILARVEPETEKALEYIRKAHDLTIDAGKPAGRMLVAELELRMERGVVENCPELLRKIESRHIKEPGVSQQLMQTLMRFGIIGPDGRPREMQPQNMEAQPAGAVAEGGIWTPESGNPADAGGEKKLWVPD